MTPEQTTPRSRGFEKLRDSSGSLEVSHILWYPKDRYCVHENSALFLILSRMNLVCAVPSYFSMIRFNTVLPFSPLTSKMVPFFQVSRNLPRPPRFQTANILITQFSSSSPHLVPLITKITVLQETKFHTHMKQQTRL
jgi:hypothetical protein